MVNENYREYELSMGKVILCGKSAEQNDLLVAAAEPKDVLIHTKEPGSPFCNLGEKPTKNEVSEAAVFCAARSQFWRDHHKDVVVHVFKKSDMNKSKLMKAGTWGVKKFKEVLVKKSEIEKLSI
jgi:predicted ribosome quality control (RQC) complex YloA/Tae2 family protein